jgi:hypothetical protein
MYVIVRVCVCVSVGLSPKGNYKETKPGVKTPEIFAKSKLLIYLYILLVCIQTTYLIKSLIFPQETQ